MIPFIIVLVLVVVIAEHISLRHGLDGIEFDYRPSSPVNEPGEPFDLVTTISNKSRWFVPYVKMEELLPQEADIHGENIHIREAIHGNKTHISTVYLLPLKALERRLTLSIDKRGRYFFRGAKLKGGDFLGINEETRDESILREMVILPKEAVVPELSRILGGYLGDISVRRFLMEDPVLTSGFREYTGREPMKSISWTQSAKIDRLMVKQFDYTVEPTATVLLNVEYGGEKDGELIEGCFSLARTVCTFLDNRQVKFNFFTNASASGAFSLWSSIGEGLGRRHLMTILEGLGRATYQPMEPFYATALKASSNMEGNRSVILITPKNDILPEIQTIIKNRTGNPGVLIAAEEVLS